LRILQGGFRQKLDVPDSRQVHDHFIIVPVPPREQ
jgi:hydroxyacylglutathione hydrolase